MPFGKVRVKIFDSDQVAETCDACDRTEDLRVLRFSIYADFDQLFMGIRKMAGLSQRKVFMGREGCR